MPIVSLKRHRFGCAIPVCEENMVNAELQGGRPDISLGSSAGPECGTRNALRQLTPPDASPTAPPSALRDDHDQSGARYASAIKVTAQGG